MNDFVDYHNGPNLGLEPPAAPKADAAQAQPAASDEHLIETGCYQTVIDRHSQPAANQEPSDEEIDSVAASMPDGAGGMLKQWGYRQFARALLARYGQPAEGEEIMVNTTYDVFTLPLQPSGLSSGPRFVVHVPTQPADDFDDSDIPFIRNDGRF